MSGPGNARAPHRLPAFELAQLLGRRELSSEELVTAFLVEIDRRDGELKAWQFLDPDLSLEQARTRDTEEQRGPLHGVPVGLKDIIDTTDMPTTYGTSIYSGFRPGSDAVCVERLRTAGAVVLGKTVTTELATWHPAETTNPHNAKHTPGGSSSGSAAAVGADLVPLALGTQTMGSAIRPASFCGVLAMKPTFGIVDLTGVKRTSVRMDTIGLFGRHPKDLKMLLVALGSAPCPSHLPRAPRRIGIIHTPWWKHADPDSRRAVEHAADALRDAGIEVSRGALPPEFDSLPEAQNLIAVADIARNLAWEYEQHREELSDVLCEHIELGRTTRGRDYEAAVSTVDWCRKELGAIFARWEVLLVPAVTGEAPRGLASTGNPIFCRAWTALGTPATTIPTARGSNGLPVGVQLVGPLGGDTAVLNATETLFEAIRK